MLRGDSLCIIRAVGSKGARDSELFCVQLCPACDGGWQQAVPLFYGQLVLINQKNAVSTVSLPLQLSWCAAVRFGTKWPPCITLHLKSWESPCETFWGQETKGTIAMQTVSTVFRMAFSDYFWCVSYFMAVKWGEVERFLSALSS